jgi:hypothetical protein
MACDAYGVTGINALQLIRVEEGDGDLQLLRPRRRVLPLGAMVFRQVGLQPQWSSLLHVRMCVVRSFGRDDYTHAFRVGRPSHWIAHCRSPYRSTVRTRRVGDSNKPVQPPSSDVWGSHAEENHRILIVYEVIACVDVRIRSTSQVAHR